VPDPSSNCAFLRQTSSAGSRSRKYSASAGSSEASDLEQFLFETSRQVLFKVGKSLTKLFGANCFYCGERYTLADVDHFVPFAMYPRDLIHNFVVAHPRCNRSKSDTLAAHVHLEHWIDRLRDRSDDLMEIGANLGVSGDAGSSISITQWAYESSYAGGASAWVEPKLYEAIDGRYVDSFRSTFS
jgi:hypothetical protein